MNSKSPEKRKPNTTYHKRSKSHNPPFNSTNIYLNKISETKNQRKKSKNGRKNLQKFNLTNSSKFSVENSKSTLKHKPGHKRNKTVDHNVSKTLPGKNRNIIQ